MESTQCDFASLLWEGSSFVRVAYIPVKANSLRTAFEVLRLGGIQEDRIFAGDGASCSGTAIDIRAGLGQAPRDFFLKRVRVTLWQTASIWGGQGASGITCWLD